MRTRRTTVARTVALVALLTTAVTSAQDLLWTRDGEAPESRFADAVAAAGDVDGDGLADVIVGASELDGAAGHEAGKAYVYDGATGALLFAWEGPREHARFGSAVAGAGDTDGDGFGDLLVGAWLLTSVPGGNEDGAAFLLSGDDGRVLQQWTSHRKNGQLGYAVAAPGDLDGDALPDVVVGAREWLAGDGGSVFAYSGLGEPLWFATRDEYRGEFGAALAPLGDVDGDGRSEILAGAPDEDTERGAEGNAYLLSGADGTFLHTHDGEEERQRFAASVAGAGDLDGDGTADLVVGADDWDKVYLYSGADGALLDAWNGDYGGDEFGGVVAGGGDVDGDGTSDLLVGAGRHDGAAGDDTGRAYLVSGATRAFAWSWDGEAVDDHFARHGLAVAGDVDGDGVADVVVGASDHDGAAGTDGGRVYLYSGLVDAGGERARSPSR